MKCANCGKEHDRRKFCSTKCKDNYHNRMNPRGKNKLPTETVKKDTSNEPTYH